MCVCACVHPADAIARVYLVEHMHVVQQLDSEQREQQNWGPPTGALGGGVSGGDGRCRRGGGPTAPPDAAALMAAAAATGAPALLPAPWKN